MNSTQLQTTLAPLVSFFAGLLAAKVPWLDVGAATQLIGAVVGVAATLWAAFSTKKSTLVSTVAQMPEVQSVKLEASASSDLVAATPTNVTK